MAHVLYGVERQGDINLQYAQNGLELNFTEVYRVRADSKTVSMWEVMRDATATDAGVIALLGTNGGVQATGLPLPGYTIDRDGVCRCQNLGGQRSEEQPLEWEFTANWSSRVQDGRGGASQNGDPTVPLEAVIPIRETTYDPITRSRNVDLNGNFYLNGAGQGFGGGVSSDEELPRWDFAQFDVNYEGAVTNFSSTYQGLSGQYAVLTEPDYLNPGTPWVYAPGVYRSVGGSPHTFFAPTDATIFYLNGCVNMIPWLGFKEFTMLLRVRSSKVGFYNGVRKRLTEFSVTYDPQKWWDQPVNKGPYFVAPKLDRKTGNVVNGFDLYPYIYFTSLQEESTTDLVIDQDGLLVHDTVQFSPIVYPGNRVYELELGFSPTGWRVSSIFLNLQGTTEWFGLPRAGFTKVETAPDSSGSREWTYRANRPQGTVQPTVLQYASRNLLPFAGYLRPTLTGPYIP